MRVLVAPDKFKGSLPARAVADAMAIGIRERFPDASIVCCPVADGGEGTVDALVAAVGGRVENVEVHGPLGDIVRAGIGWLDDDRAVIEVSSAAGLSLVSRSDPLRATSVGCGDLILTILKRNRQTSVVVGVGGSASTDGGTGAAAAVGWRFLDVRGRELERGGGALRRLAAIDSAGVADVIEGARVLGAVDVDNPLVGRRGSARVFAPQKGADADDVAILEEALVVLADKIRADLGIDVSDLPGGGGAGGIGAGLVAFFGAQLRPGFEVVADSTGLGNHLRSADVVVTGEGRLDKGSLGGKAPIGVARLAAGAGVPCVAVVGAMSLADGELHAAGIRRVVSLSDRFGEKEAKARPGELIPLATAEAVALPQFT